MTEDRILVEAEKYAITQGHHGYNERFYGFIAGANFVKNKLMKPNNMKDEYVQLLKVKTLDDAEHPQEEKYNSGTVLAIGKFLKIPTVGENFYMSKYQEAMGRYFRTSPVVTVDLVENNLVEFTTVNSKYKITPFNLSSKSTVGE